MKKRRAALVITLLALLSTAPAAAAASPRQHLFVGFISAPGAAERALIQRLGGTVRFSFPSVQALAIDLAGDRVAALSRAPGVTYVEADPVRTPLDLTTAQLVPDISNGLYGLVTTHAVAAHNAGYTGNGVKACVADTGLDTTHPDIADNFVMGYNVFDNNNDVDVFSLGVEATETHATHVSGILLGVDNSVGILGVAPGAQLYEARVLGTQTDGSVSGTTSQVMAGVQWLAGQGCKVINMSLGGGSRSRTEEALYKQVTAGGTLIVAASGNDSAKKLSYPAAYPEVLAVGAVDRNNAIAAFSNTGHGLGLVAPGVDNLSSVPAGQGTNAFVTVGTSTFGALGMEFAPKTTTSGVTGTLVDCGLAATAADCGASPPAGFIAVIERGTYSFAQKVDSAMGAGAAGAIIYNNVSGNFNGTLGTADDNGTPWIPAVSLSMEDGLLLVPHAGESTTLVAAPYDWDVFSGTSMATPHVSGVAALLYGKNPSLTVSQITDILEATAQDLGRHGYDTTYGFGLVDATAALAATP